MTTKRTIPVAGPWITQREIDYVTDAVKNAWYEGSNMYHERLEKEFARRLGVEFAITLPSCTSAIHLALAALGVGPGDEVVVPDITWIASAAPITYVGATPVFCDVEPDTWCMSATSFEKCLTSRTKAVIPVDPYGGMPDLDAITRIAARHGVAVIEDAAQAAGSRYRDRPAGSFGDAGVFSFHGSKTLTTGEGGLLATRRRDLRDRVMILRDHGRDPKDPRMFYNQEVGFKYKMSAMQAALGLAQLERLDELVEKKRRIFDWYRERLADLEGVEINAEPDGILNTYWMVTPIWSDRYPVEKQPVIEALAAAGISARPFFYPLSSLPAYAATPGVEAARAANLVSERVSRRGVNLPSALTLEEADVNRVCEEFRRVLTASGGAGTPAAGS